MVVSDISRNSWWWDKNGHLSVGSEPFLVADSVEITHHRPAKTTVVSTSHTLYEYENVDADNIGSAYKHHYRLPNWKDEFSVFSEVNSKALQRTVTRFYDNLSNLKDQKEHGNKVGKLKWKSPREFQSMTFSQSGFELKNTSGRRATLWLSKIGDIKICYHREIPDEADIKEVTIKKETTGEWFVSFGLETADADLPEKPDVELLDASNSIGIDLGILNYIHTSDGKTVDWLDLKTSTSVCAANNASYRGSKKGRTTGRNNAGKLRMSSVTFVGRCWTTNTRLQRGLSASTTRCSLRT